MKAKIISLTLAMSVLFFLHLSAQELSIVGTWKLVSQRIINADGGVTTADSAALNQIKVYTPTMFVNIGERKIPELNNQKIVVSCAGGHYSLKGNDYEEFTEFASYKDYKDMKVKFKLTMEKGRIHTIGSLSGADGMVTIYDEWYNKVEVPVQSKELVGTWKAVSQSVNNPDGSMFTSDSTTTNMRKLFTPGMVIVIREAIVPQAGNQKIVVSCAGGRYTLKDGLYEELISFASYKDFDSMKVRFNLKIENGKLHTFGSLKDKNGQVAIYDEWFVRAD